MEIYRMQLENILKDLLKSDRFGMEIMLVFKCTY